MSGVIRRVPCARPFIMVMVLIFMSSFGWAYERVGTERANQQNAQDYFFQGNVLFDSQDYEDAAKMFRVAMVLRPDLPGPYRRLGQTLKRLDRCSEAVDYYVKYLELQPDGKFSPEVRQEMETCADRIAMITLQKSAKIPMGTLDLVCSVDGAEVTIDGIYAGHSPLEGWALSSGVHEVVVSAERHSPWRSEVTIEQGRTLRLDVELAKSRPRKNHRRGVVQLFVEPQGTRIYVNNNLAGVAPISELSLLPGNYIIRAEADGFMGQAHNMRVEPGEELRLALKMVPANPALILPPNGVSMEGQYGGASDVFGVGMQYHVAPRAKVVGWSSVLLGTVATLTGGVFGVLALNRQDAYFAESPMADRRRLKEEGERFRLGADVLLATGTTLLLTGSVLLLLTDKAPVGPPVDVYPHGTASSLVPYGGNQTGDVQSLNQTEP